MSNPRTVIQTVIGKALSTIIGSEITSSIVYDWVDRETWQDSEVWIDDSIAPPFITVNPVEDATVDEGTIFSLASFAVNFDTVQWFKDNLSLAPEGQTPSIITAEVVLDDEGVYFARYTNIYGDSDTTTSTITVEETATPPVIGLDPQDETRNQGEEVIFTSTASDYLTVQWFENNTPLAGQNEIDLSFITVLTDDGNTYFARYSNNAGDTDTEDAILTINQPPVITLQPQDDTVLDGNEVTFESAATDFDSVQWFENGSEFVGQTSPILTFTAVIADDTNAYFARYTNIGGSTDTVIVTLGVEEGTNLYSPVNFVSNPDLYGVLTSFSGTPEGSMDPENVGGINIEGLFTDFDGEGADEISLTLATALDVPVVALTMGGETATLIHITDFIFIAPNEPIMGAFIQATALAQESVGITFHIPTHQFTIELDALVNIGWSGNAYGDMQPVTIGEHPEIMTQFRGPQSDDVMQIWMPEISGMDITVEYDLEGTPTTIVIPWVPFGVYEIDDADFKTWVTANVGNTMGINMTATPPPPTHNLTIEFSNPLIGWEAGNMGAIDTDQLEGQTMTGIVGDGSDSNASRIIMSQIGSVTTVNVTYDLDGANLTIPFAWQVGMYRNLGGNFRQWLIANDNTTQPLIIKSA